MLEKQQNNKEENNIEETVKYVLSSHSLALILELGLLEFTLEEYATTRTMMTILLIIPYIRKAYERIHDNLSEKFDIH